MKKAYAGFFLVSVLVLALSGPCLAQGLVTISFDDGLSSVFDKAYPILAQRKLTGVTALIAENVRWPHAGFMTAEQALELQNHKWEIASHSIHHVGANQIPLTLAEEPYVFKAEKVEGITLYKAPYAFERVVDVFDSGYPMIPMGSVKEMLISGGGWFHDPEAKVVWARPRFNPEAPEIRLLIGSYEREMQGSLAELRGKGLNVTTYIAPFSKWKPGGIELARKYYTAAAHDLDWSERPINFDPFDIDRVSVRSATKAADIITLIQKRVVKNEEWVVLCLHGLDGQGYEPWSSEELKTLAAWLAKHKKDAPVVTVSQGIRLWQRAHPGEPAPQPPHQPEQQSEQQSMIGDFFAHLGF